VNRSFVRRAASIAAASVLGLVGAAVIAGPAQAHHSELSGEAECDTTTGEWVVTWTVSVVAPPEAHHYKLTEVVAKQWVGDADTEVSVPGIAVTEGDDYPHPSNEPLVGTVRLPGDSTAMSLKIKSKWINNFQENEPVKKTVTFSGACEQDTSPPPAQPRPTATVRAECDGSAVVTLENAKDATAPAKFTVTGEGGVPKEQAVEPGGSAKVTVPAEHAGKITVTVAGQETPLFEGAPEAPEGCVATGEPEGFFEATCDELSFTIANPKDGETASATFTPSAGEPRTLTVEPGQTESVSFDASPDLTVTISAPGEDDVVVSWDDEKPADCGGGSGGGGDLPKTGASVGGAAAAAALLLGVGAGLFYLFRRRRLRFVA
jgi:LPXTG-motif cell wall-anchored protein